MELFGTRPAMDLSFKSKKQLRTQRTNLQQIFHTQNSQQDCYPPKIAITSLKQDNNQIVNFMFLKHLNHCLLFRFQQINDFFSCFSNR